MEDVVAQRINELKDSLIDYLPEGEYTMDAVSNCMKYIRTYTSCIQGASSDEDAMNCVKQVVLRLNDLNEEADFTLIETDQREMLGEIIQTVYEGRFSTDTSDVTEEFREW